MILPYLLDGENLNQNTMLDADPNSAIRDYVTSDKVNGWKHKQMADRCYEMSDIFKMYFFSPKDETQPVIPNLVLAFPELNVRTLAQYRLVPNALGLSYEVSLNSLYLNRPEWEIYESLLHELVHLFQESTPGFGTCKNGYHSSAFVDICEQVGLHPLPIFGAHWKPADGAFERLMDLCGVLKPAHAYGDFKKPEDKKEKGENWFDKDRGKKKGSSTLKLYTCECDPPFKLRVGRDNLTALCLACQSPFTLVP